MTHESLNAQEVLLRVKRLDKLETPPRLAHRMMAYIDNPRASVSTLSRWIAGDQVLAARVLKLANSDNYGYAGQVSTLNLAIVIIGFHALRELLMSISVIDQFAESVFGPVDPLGIHSLQVAAGARCLAKMAGYPVIGEAFVAGLLHDVGHTIFLQEFPEQFKEAVHWSKIKKLSYHEAEKELFGFDHTELGAWLAREWNFPDSLISVIRHHHSEDLSSDNDLIRLVHLADLICYSMDDEDILQDPVMEQDLESEILKKLKVFFSINSHPLNYFQRRFRTEQKQVKESLNPLFSAGVKN